MSFFTATTNITAKPQIRQEGFAPDDLFSSPLIQKYPSSPLNLPSIDFGDELAGLMATDHNDDPPSAYQNQHYRHNIFDTSSVSSSASVYPPYNGSQPSSLHSDFASFNSNLPALNSSMRYDPHPLPHHQQPQNDSTTNPPPSSFHSHSHLSSSSNRHTPSPPINGSVGSGSLHSPVIGSSASVGRGVGSRSRSSSNSRLPVVASSSSNSSSNTSGGGNTGSIGPARTTRTRRNGSISGTSPPPFGHGHGRPHAIVIPGNGRTGATGGSTGNWFVNGGQSSPHPPNQHHHSLSLSLGGGASSSSHHHSHSHHPNSHSLSGIPRSPVVSNGAQVASPLLTTLPLGNGTHSHSPSLSHGHQQQQQQHHGHHGHTPSLSHSLSHSGALNGGLNSMGSIGMSGYGMNGMGMNSLDGSMGMMGGIGMGVANGGLPLGPLNPLQSPSLQNSSLSTANNNNNSAPLPSPPGQPLLPSSSVGSSPPLSGTTITTNHHDKQSILANEKRRRRRESHNAVERRRRDNINEKISELATLIPECMLEGGGSGHGGSSPSHVTPTSPGASGMGLLDGSDPLLPSCYGITNVSSSPIKEENGGPETEGGGIVKANKGMILRKSVDYIRYLQQLVTAQGARNRELEQELKAYRGSSDSGHGSGSIDSDSPELNGYQQQRRSHTIGEGRSHSMSSPSDGSKGESDDILMLHDGVGGIGNGPNNNSDGGGGGAIEFGSYGTGERGGLPSMPEGDDEDDEDGDSHHQHHHHHHQQQQHHHQREDMEVDMGMNMGMMGMNSMNGDGGGSDAMHFNGMDHNVMAENLRGRTRVVRRPSDGGISADNNNKNISTGIGGGALKTEIGDDDGVLDVVGGFGIGIGRTTTTTIHGM